MIDRAAYMLIKMQTNGRGFAKKIAAWKLLRREHWHLSEIWHQAALKKWTIKAASVEDHSDSLVITDSDSLKETILSEYYTVLENVLFRLSGENYKPPIWPFSFSYCFNLTWISVSSLF